MIKNTAPKNELSNFGTGGGTNLLRRRMLMRQNISENYITEGLLYRWVAEDVKNDLWADRISGKIINLFNTQKDGNRLIFDGQSSYGSTDSAEIGMDCTLEVVANATRNSSVFVCFANNIGVAVNSSGKIIIGQPGSYVFETNGLQKQTLSVTGGENCIAVQNQIELQKANADYLYSVNKNWLVGKRDGGTYNDYFLDGNIYEIRLYNRRLSTDEIVSNQKIDMEKYF